MDWNVFLHALLQANSSLCMFVADLQSVNSVRDQVNRSGSPVGYEAKRLPARSTKAVLVFYGIWNRFNISTESLTELLVFKVCTQILIMSILQKFADQAIAWNEVPAASFNDHLWQNQNTIQTKEKLVQFLNKVYPADSGAGIIMDVTHGLHLSPMSIKISPYVLSRIKWKDFYSCPVRKQFIPIGQEILPDHPAAKLDSLNEQHDSPVEGLVHRYPSKVLFLALSVCPVFCRFCTRSYAVGNATYSVESKAAVKPSHTRMEKMFEYIKENKQINDVVVSGGDVYMLSPQMLHTIGYSLLHMENVRFIRFATKGLAVMPMKILSDHAWTEKIIEISLYARSLGKQVVIHTHFNHSNEITDTTRKACSLLYRNGVIVRNQSVLMRTVNDDVESMSTLLNDLASMNVYPYYVFQHDIVQGSEYFRTPLTTILNMEKQIRGSLAGFNTPNFTVDTFGGGGKRIASSYETYDRVSGISTYVSPAVDSSRLFYHVDPLHSLDTEGKDLWSVHGDDYLRRFTKLYASKTGY